jgi:hypothetical protein
MREGKRSVVVALLGCVLVVFFLGRNTSCVRDGDEKVVALCPGRLDEWLGAQDYPGLNEPENLKLAKDMWSAECKGYTITLRVVRGDELRWQLLPATLWRSLPSGLQRILPLAPAPRVTTFDSKRHCVAAVDEIVIDEDALYVFGRCVAWESGIRIYTLDVRVTDGPLTGALVHLRDGQRPEPGGPYYCAYKIPAASNMPRGRIPFEVVMYSSELWFGTSDAGFPYRGREK